MKSQKKCIKINESTDIIDTIINNNKLNKNEINF